MNEILAQLIADNTVLGQVFTAITMRLVEALDKHPTFADGRFNALGVIEDEFEEFKHAVLYESEERQTDEALDVIVTCLRFIHGEHLRGTK